MTYRRIEDQLKASQNNYWLFCHAGIDRHQCWDHPVVPAHVGHGPLTAISENPGIDHTAMPEANLPESDDDMGQVFKAANDLIIRFKSESQRQWTDQRSRGEQEKTWVLQLARSFLPEGRVLIADKDNHVLSDITQGNGVNTASTRNAHLLDLIKDAKFC